MRRIGASWVVLLALSASAASAEEEVCGGLPSELRSGEIEGDLVVQEGQCQLTDAVVHGKAVVRSGGALNALTSVIELDLVIEGGRVDLHTSEVKGNVTLASGAELSARDSSVVRGDIAVEGCFRIFESTVDGNVLVTAGAIGPSRDATFGGDVTIRNAKFRACSDAVSNFTKVTVGGSLDYQDGQRGIVVSETAILGDLRVRAVELGSSVYAALLSSRVGGNAEIHDVQGGISTIGKNSIGGNLDCQNIDPPPITVGHSLVAGDKLGQCTEGAGF